MATVSDVEIRTVYDSRCDRTFAATVETKRGGKGSFATPSGASVGTHEVPAFPPGGIGAATTFFNETVKDGLIGISFENPEDFDRELLRLDGTGRFEAMGGSLSTALSLAAAESAAAESDVELYEWLGVSDPRFPAPLGNVVGGGRHAPGKSTDIQEFLVFPRQAPSYSVAYGSLTRIHRAIGEFLAQGDPAFSGGKNDEGAWTTSLGAEDTLSLLSEVSETESSEEMEFLGGLDVAANELWSEASQSYFYRREGSQRTAMEQLDYMERLAENHGLGYLEDPLHEDDFDGFSEMTSRLGEVVVCGDDLYVTDADRVETGKNLGAGNAVLIKPNQAGSFTRAREAAQAAKSAGFRVVVSHRSGETVNGHLSHVALALGADLFKAGVVGGERVVKHNEMMKIEEREGSKPIELE